MSSNLRIGGLVSGLEVDAIIKDMMAIKRVPLDRLEQEKQILQWQQEDYRELNTSLRSFRDKVFNMRLQSTYQAKTAVSSNAGAVAAAATGSAIPGRYTVTVTQLAEGVLKGSQAALADETDAEGNTKTLAGQFTTLSGSISFTLEGSAGSREFAFDTATDNIYTVVAEINAADLGISAGYDANLNRFFLSTASTGADAVIKVTADSDNFLTGPLEDGSDNVLKLQMKLYGAGPPEEGLYAGQDARFDFGDAGGLTSASNTVTVNGITLNLKEGGGAGSTITIANDTDAVYEAVTEFITAYNEVIEQINDKLAETRYRDYPPLTGAQRKEMSETEIERWEEFARSGLLRNDTLLNRVAINMRATMSAVVPGLTAGAGYDNLAGTGITTGTYDEKGKLYVDEDRLREALQEDPEGVRNLFTTSSDTYQEKGIAMRLYEDVNNAMSLLAAKAGSDSSYSLADNSTIGKRMAQIDGDIDKLEERLNKIEDRYWRQFTALERAVQQMNAQSAWLYQQFGGMQGY